MCVGPPACITDLANLTGRCCYLDAMTMVAGVTTFIDGQSTGALPGGLVRNPRASSVRGVTIPPPRPYQELLSGIGNLADGAGDDSVSDADRGVNAALDVEDTGASALARLQRAANSSAKDQKSKL